MLLKPHLIQPGLRAQLSSFRDSPTFTESHRRVSRRSRPLQKPEGARTRPSWLLCFKHMIGHLGRHVRGSLRCQSQYKRIVIREIVTPTFRIVDASAIVAWYCALVVAQEPTPYRDFRLFFAAILPGQNAAIRNADQRERVRVCSAIPKARRLRHNSEGV